MSHDFGIAKEQFFDDSKKLFFPCISDFMKYFEELLDKIISILLRTQQLFPENLVNTVVWYFPPLRQRMGDFTLICLKTSLETSRRYNSNKV